MTGAALLAPTFRYAAVPPEHHDWLRSRAEFVNTTAYRVVCDYVRIGEALAEVAKCLRRKRLFKAWVNAFCPFGRPYAYKLMKVAAAFGPHVKPDAPEVIDSKALVILAAAPAEVVAYAVEQAGDGHRVTVREARVMIAEYRRRVTPSPDEARKHRAAVALCEQEERKHLEETAKRNERAGVALGRLEQLARLGGVVTINAVEDVEDDPDDDPAPYHVAVMLPEASPRSATRRTLSDAFAAVLGEEFTRYCAGCDDDKPLSDFGENQFKTLGKCSRCRVCELARVRDYKRQQRADARAGRVKTPA